MTKAARWGWTVAALATTGAVLVLAFVLSISGPENQLYEQQFAWLFWINVAVAALLSLVIGVVAVRMVLRLRSGKFGSRLLLKLAGIFAIVGVLPGLVIYTVSWQFASRSIESWFDVRVAGALDAGLALGRSTLESLQSDLAEKASVAAARLAEPPVVIGPLTLERLREQLGALEVSVIAASGQVLVSAVASRTGTGNTAGTAGAGGSGGAGGAGGTGGTVGLGVLGGAERPPSDLLRQARTGVPASQIEGLEDDTAGARIRLLVPVPSNAISLNATEVRFLLVVQPLPRALTSNALAVQSAYSEYQQRALAREALRRMYIGTLTLALVLAVFGAVLLAIVLGNQLTRPLILLAEGVREVAAGNLAARPVFASGDELGGLTRSFADMTQQVADARAQVQRGVDQLESARTRLQTILDNLTAGVILFNREGCIDTVNPGATRILRQPLQAYAGRPMQELPELAAFADGVAQRFATLVAGSDPGEREQWQDSFELRTAQPGAITLLARGAMLPGDARLLVFDDITEVVSAQRAQAWAEVARRLAHEIKNPLTPIQLSAERLQHKLASRLEGADQAMLVRGVGVIVDQVEAMKQLVNEFRDYARLPSAQLHPLALNGLVQDVASLYGQAQEQGQLSLALGADLPDILGDGAQLRQVIHNLVQNALDAVSQREGGQVLLVTEAVRGEADGAVTAVRLSVVDNGPGFVEQVLRRAFEPYVTTKPRGTGLGLAVVKKIADEHRARVRIRNRHEGDLPDGPVTGARVSLSFFALAQSTLGTPPVRSA
jgi:nitrogen fixation/metabolism regulation signal transduction histidine kinase